MKAIANGRHEIETVQRVGGSRYHDMTRLFLEEAAELVRETTAAAVVASVGRTTVARGALLLVLVLLDLVFGNAAHDGTTDGSEETVVGLVAHEATSGTAGEGTGKTTLALLSLTRSSLLLLVARMN